MIFVAWPHASIEKQLAWGQMGMSQFRRHSKIKVCYLCYGDFPKKVQRYHGGVVGVQVPLIAFPLIGSRFPITELAIREVFALVSVVAFCKRYRPAFLDNTSPAFDMWRMTMLKWLLPVTLTTQVAGNLDLIYSNFLKTPARGLSLKQIYSFAWIVRIKFMAQLFYRSVDLAVGYNINNQNSAISNGCHPSKATLVRIRINREGLFAPHHALELMHDLPRGVKIISLWSRLSVGKYILEAFAGCVPLLQRRNDICLVIAGDGELREPIRSLAIEYGLDRQVYLIGKKDHAYISSLARHSDVVLAQYSGSALVECALLERPCVAFNIEWHNELVTDGETGWLVDHSVPADVAAALEEAIDHPHLASERAKRLKLRAEKMFDERKIKAEFELLFDRLLNELE
jgi:glycosyltransferase involved in cell wall biosynthesis